MSVLTVREDAQLYPSIVFFETLVDRVGYWMWYSGIIPAEWGAYAENTPPNRAELRKMLLQHGLFCQGVANIALRFAGYEIPHRNHDERYDGGIYAAWGGDVGFGWTDGYYTESSVAFDPDRAAAWAREERSGVLLGTPYEGQALNMQGHTGICLPSSYILQSAAGEGLHWSRTVWMEREYWESHSGRMVHPRRWIELQGALRRERQVLR